ncbi:MULTISPECIES: flagellar protein FlaG [unclassified Clostridium]|uniref:flagellar protein FlaG n=1 Tax=unclassified Clostridium TaxID=2614128 RepID=UPI0002974F85|nr:MULTISPECIES: flagellar protein FlaG [unclassified Clostridium]EKQ51141.1 MAG: flagellar protein FlaG [Clostridium sp. Maddingley MBC34-26]
MDVNGINRRQEYSDVYNNAIDTTKYSNPIPNDEDQVKSTVIEKDNTNQEFLNQDPKNLKKEDLDKAINKLNKSLEDEKVHAEYSIHKDLGTLMIKIVDDDTKKVVMELPPEKILNMIAFICKQDGLLDKKA